MTEKERALFEIAYDNLHAAMRAIEYINAGGYAQWLSGTWMHNSNPEPWLKDIYYAMVDAAVLIARKRAEEDKEEGAEESA